MPPVHSVPDRMLRREDVLAARLKVWKSRTDDTALTRFGDVIARRPREDEIGSDLWLYGWRRAGWWVKPQLGGVVFRPRLTAHKDLSYEDGGRYDYSFHHGTFILLWGSSYLVPAKVSCIPFEGPHHYCMEIVSEIMEKRQ